MEVGGFSLIKYVYAYEATKFPNEYCAASVHAFFLRLGTAAASPSGVTAAASSSWQQLAASS
jgi:hypothetical protein